MHLFRLQVQSHQHPLGVGEISYDLSNGDRELAHEGRDGQDLVAEPLLANHHQVPAGEVLAADDGAILGSLQAAGDRMWPRMAKSDWAGRSADQLSPQTYPDWDA